MCQPMQRQRRERDDKMGELTQSGVDGCRCGMEDAPAPNIFSAITTTRHIVIHTAGLTAVSLAIQ